MTDYGQLSDADLSRRERQDRDTRATAELLRRRLAGPDGAALAKWMEGGGSVYPFDMVLPSGPRVYATGITFRDHVAIHALARIPYDAAKPYADTARDAYAMADAMMAASKEAV